MATHRHWMFYFFYSFLLAVLCSPCRVNADPTNIDILLSSDQSYYQDVSTALIESIDPRYDVTPHKHILSAKTVLNPDSQLIVAVGTKATKRALRDCHETPVLSIFIPQATFSSITNAREECKGQPIAAIFLDQPLSRFIKLATQLKPNVKRLGVVFGPASKRQLSEIEQLASEYGLTLNQVTISNNDNPISKLRPLVANSDVILPLPDKGSINRAVAKWILNLSFQTKTPVIGFSNAYTDAGAAASIYSSPKNLGHQAGRFISNWQKNPQSHIWSSSLPTEYTLKINKIVSRSLDLNLINVDQLKRRIDQQGGSE